tara:strand:- start:41 stop:502 length:462 start_codon:yes stop_codon:yes gene_type:complete
MESLIKLLTKKNFKISVAESCTGGMLASQITSISGSSKVFDLGFITYSNQAKIKILKVSRNIINRYGAVSHECCAAMVNNLSKISKANINVSITGIAGPNGGTKQKPVGLVYIGIKKGKKSSINKYYFKGKKRKIIQKATVKKALNLILRIAK